MSYSTALTILRLGTLLNDLSVKSEYAVDLWRGNWQLRHCCTHRSGGEAPVFGLYLS